MDLLDLLLLLVLLRVAENRVEVHRFEMKLRGVMAKRLPATDVKKKKMIARRKPTMKTRHQERRSRCLIDKETPREW